jgi:hypothetical protein
VILSGKTHRGTATVLLRQVRRVMAEVWFWKHKGQTLGPLSTDTLEGLVKEHRIFDRDEVRFVKSNEWITGAQSKALFSGADGRLLLGGGRRPVGARPPSRRRGRTGHCGNIDSASTSSSGRGNRRLVVGRGDRSHWPNLRGGGCGPPPAWNCGLIRVNRSTASFDPIASASRNSVDSMIEDTVVIWSYFEIGYTTALS